MLLGAILMSLIHISHLSFTYEGSCDPVFEDVSVQLDTNWRLGFLGRNGRGKTTLLRLLMGEGVYTGTISAPEGFDYFPFAVPDPEEDGQAVAEVLRPGLEQWRLLRELRMLELDEGVLYRPFRTLSNGEQTKVLIAALFLNEGHFLLIDEPTNHLDAKARKSVAAYLKKKKGFILVSHDRRFLDDCVDYILSINRANIEVQRGNFSSWMSNFERQQEFELAQNERLQKDIRRLQQSAKRAAVWSERVEASKIGAADKGYVGHKAAKMMKRSKSIEARQQQTIEQKSALLKNMETAEALKIQPLNYHTDLLASLSNVVVYYDGISVCEPVSFEIRQGERIVLDGKNGSGKSSLLKLVVGQSIDYTGTVTLGSGLVISYVPQDTSYLCGTLSEFAEENNLDESLFKAILRKMDFERVQFEKDIKDFSGGQKKKVLIAKSLCEKAHLYVWDEPLNFIDVYSRMQIEQLITEFAPTMLLVEHDSVFRDTVASKIVNI